MKGKFKPKEHKPPIANQQNVVLIIVSSVVRVMQTGFMTRHSHQRVLEHKRPTTGSHVKDEHGKDPETITSNSKY